MLTFKISAASLVFLAGILGGVLARKFSLTNKSFASLANTFAGGVFLGAALLHMLPDAIKQFQLFAPESNYPFFALIVATGFLLVLMLDRVIVSSHEELVAQGAIYPYILMFTLSIHSIITGIALGLEDKVISAAATPRHSDTV